MKYWIRYKNFVARQCNTHIVEDGGLQYWKDILFIETLSYTVPLCFVALIPGVYLSFISNLVFLGIFDMVIVGGFASLAFIPSIPLKQKKMGFIFCFYSLAVVLVYYLGLLGPGLLYLFCGTIFVIMFLDTKYGLISASVNLLICLLFAVLLYHELIVWGVEINPDPETWIAVSSNLVFLSFLAAVLLPMLFFGMQSTINEKKSLEQDLIRQNKKLQSALGELKIRNREIEEFSLLAAHDLSEPLRNINTMIKVIERDYYPEQSEKLERYFSILKSSSKRMIRLIEDLTTYTQIGVIKNQKQDIDLFSFLSALLEEYREEIQSAGASVVIKCRHVIKSDTHSLERLFRNLLSNSIKYRSKSRVLMIEISSEELGDQYQIIYKDNGTGIAKEFIPDAFTVFNRFHKEIENEGSGLGLATCQKVTQMLGGDIELTSDTGMGCEFRITLPKSLTQTAETRVLN